MFNVLTETFSIELPCAPLSVWLSVPSVPSLPSPWLSVHSVCTVDSVPHCVYPLSVWLSVPSVPCACILVSVFYGNLAFSLSVIFSVHIHYTSVICPLFIR